MTKCWWLKPVDLCVNRVRWAIGIGPDPECSAATGLCHPLPTAPLVIEGRGPWTKRAKSPLDARCQMTTLYLGYPRRKGPPLSTRPEDSGLARADALKRRQRCPRLLRVRTRFVQKCTLSARAEAARADEVIERLPGHPGDLGDRALRDPEPEESADLVLFAVEA